MTRTLIIIILLAIFIPKLLKMVGERAKGVLGSLENDFWKLFFRLPMFGNGGKLESTENEDESWGK